MSRPKGRGVSIYLSRKECLCLRRALYVFENMDRCDVEDYPDIPIDEMETIRLLQVKIPDPSDTPEKFLNLDAARSFSGRMEP